MAFGIKHALTMTTPDDPAYECKPSDWNTALVLQDATSGGVLYASGTTTPACSALLAANAVVLGGGDGTAPLTSSKLTESSTAGGGLTIAAGTATTDVNGLNITQTWNASGVQFSAFKVNVTQTAAAANSRLLDLRRDNTVCLAVNSGAFGECEFWSAGGSMAFNIQGISGRKAMFISYTGLLNLVKDGTGFGFSDSTTAASGTADTNLSRISAGVIGVGTGAAGSSAGSIRGKFQSSDGTAGVASFGPSAVASITVKDGIITAIS